MVSRIFFSPREDFGYYKKIHEIYISCRFQSLLTIALLFFFAFSVPSYSQGVRIHERIEIKPENNIKLQATTSSTIPKGTLAVDSDVGEDKCAGFYIEINGVSFGPYAPVRFSECLPNGLYYFGRFPAGTVIVPVTRRLTSYVQGWPDVDLIQEPYTIETVTFEMNQETGRYEPEGYMEIYINDLLHHIEGTFSKDHIEIGEETILNLMPVSYDGGFCGLHDDLMIAVFPLASMQLLDADSMDGSTCYYRWGNAKGGIRAVGETTYGDGEFYDGNVRIWCEGGYDDSLTTAPISVRTIKDIDHFSVRIVPDTIAYGKSSKVYVQAKDENDNDMVPPYSVNLLLNIEKPLEGGAGSIRQMVPQKSKLPAIQSGTLGIYPYGYLRSPDGQFGETLYDVPYEVARESGVEYIADGDSLKSKGFINLTLAVDDQIHPTGYGTVSVISWSILVTVAPSTISPGDTADIIVQKKNYDGSIEDFPPDQKFEIGMLSGCMAGEILTSVGKATYFRDVSPPFKFVAADSVDSTNNKVLIRAGINVDNGGGGTAGSIRNVSSIEMPDNLKMKKQGSHAKLKEMRPNLSVKKKPIKTASMDACNMNEFVYDRYGVGEVGVGKKKLKILDHSPWTIWPYLPPENISHRSRGADRPGYMPWRPFTIQVLDCDNKPLGGEGVTIQAEFTEGSGGHQHSDGSAHRVLDNDKYGYFFGPEGKVQKTLDLVTKSDGKAIVDSFAQEQFSGQYLIKAYLKSDPSVFDTVNLEVKVPDLVNFRDLIVAERDKYYIFWQSTPGEINHPLNSWCTREMADSLLFAIFDFYYWSAYDKGGGIPLTLSLNDLSLPLGGTYDITGNWEYNYHSLHRCGKSIDINDTHGFMTKEQDPNNPKKLIGKMTRLGIKLEDTFLLFKFERIEEPSIHFELK